MSDEINIGYRIGGGRTEKIITHYDPPPIPDRCFDWSATFDNYDGAEDAPNRHMIGWGYTKEEAILDLMLKAEEEEA